LKTPHSSGVFFVLKRKRSYPLENEFPFKYLIFTLITRFVRSLLWYCVYCKDRIYL